MLTWAIVWLNVKFKESDNSDLVILVSILLGSMAIIGDVIIFGMIINKI